MTPACIHGFLADQCAACRSCPHGLAATRCGRCASAAQSRASRATRVKAAAAPGHPTEAHRGFEIYYVPELSGWQFRSPDSNASPLSYRSTFLARKAIDQIAAPDEGGSTAPVTTPS